MWLQGSISFADADQKKTVRNSRIVQNSGLPLPCYYSLVLAVSFRAARSLPVTWLTLDASVTLESLTSARADGSRPSHGHESAAVPTALARRSWWAQESFKTIKALLSNGCPGRDKRR